MEANAKLNKVRCDVSNLDATECVRARAAAGDAPGEPAFTQAVMNLPQGSIDVLRAFRGGAEVQARPRLESTYFQSFILMKRNLLST